MDLQEFVKKVSEQYDDAEDVEFKPETEYKKLDQWSSIVALSIIAMLNNDYDITIKGNDIAYTNTLKELFNICNVRV